MKTLILAITGTILLLVSPFYAGASSTTINYNGSSVPINTLSTWDNPSTDLFEDVIDKHFGSGHTLDLVNGISGEIETWFGTGTHTLIIEEIAGFKNNTTFGWYDSDSVDNSVSGQIFSGPDNPATGWKTTNFISPINFGFYIDPNGMPGNRMYTEHDENTDYQYQVAIFQIDNNVNDILLAWEDLPVTGNLKDNDQDYQDIMVRMSIAPVPEPATMILVGAGLIGIAGFRRRRKK